MPNAVEVKDCASCQRLPASYANYMLANNGLLLADLQAEEEGRDC